MTQTTGITTSWPEGPSGVILWVATAVAVLIALDANSRDSLSTFLLALPLWLLVAAIWLVRFVMAVRRTRGQFSRSGWVRWLAIPAVMGGALLLAHADVLFDVRLAASRDAMDRMAGEVMAGGSTERGWVGLYGVNEVERIANGVRFVIDDSGLYRLGFAYAPDGQPKLTGANYSPLWTPATVESIGNGWWSWSESWD